MKKKIKKRKPNYSEALRKIVKKHYDKDFSVKTWGIVLAERSLMRPYPARYLKQVGETGRRPWAYVARCLLIEINPERHKI